VAQVPDWTWINKTFVSSGNSAFGKAVATDNNGNVYVTGYYSGALNFPGYGQTSAGSNDIFIARYDITGNLLWAVDAGGTGDDAGLGICLDNSGFLYITGYITGNVLFSGTASNGTGQDIFVAKYSVDGVFQSVIKRITGGSTTYDRGNSITVDGSGNIYLTGCFSGQEDFGISPQVTAYDQDMFIVKINSAGTTLFAKKGGSSSLGTNGNDEGCGICVDASGNPYVTGYFSGSAAFGTNSLTTAGNHDIFIVKYNPANLNVSWLKQAGSNQQDDGFSVAIDNGSPSYVYITGTFKSTAYFGNSTVTASGSSADIFIAKYLASDGTFQWVTKAGGANDDFGKDILFDSAGNLVICGSFKNSCTFGSQTVTGYNNSYDVFIAKYTGSNSFLWAEVAGGAADDEASSLAGYGANNIFITGSYNTTAYFSSLSVTSSGNTDGFTARFNSAPVITSDPQSLTRCAGEAASFQVIANGLTTLNYQWYHNGNIITGDTLSILYFATVNLGDSGTYYCIVSNNDGNVQSNFATLTVYPVPQVSFLIDSILCNDFSTGQISLTVSDGTTPYSYLWNNLTTGSSVGNLTAGVYSYTVSDANLCTAIQDVTLTEPLAFSVSIAITEVTCFDLNDGSITLAVTGATPPYSFLWSTGATTQNINELSPGLYAVTITDNYDCVYIQSMSLSAPSDLPMQTLLTVTSPVLCYGGTANIDLEIGCGLSPYMYYWNNGATTQDLNGITAGCYTVTVYDSNEITPGNFNWSYNITGDNHSIVIPSNAPVLINGVSVTSGDVIGVFYNDGSVLKCGGYTAWSGSNIAISAWADDIVSPQKDGFVTGEVFTWKVWLDSLGIEIPMNAVYMDSLPNQGSYYSFGMSGIVSLTGTLIPGQSVTGSICVSQPGLLQISSQVTNVSCYSIQNGSVNITITGGTSPYSYHWSNNATTEDINNLAAGNYQVTVTDLNNCIATAAYIITQPLVINASAQINNVSCFGESTGSISLTVTGGTMPYSYHWSNNHTTQNISGLPQGNYVVTVTDANNCTGIFTYNITQPVTGLTGSITSVNAFCYGTCSGSVQVSPNGGVTPYIVVFNGTPDYTAPFFFTQVCAGSYMTVIIDANSCVNAYPVNISQPAAPLSVDVVPANILCYGTSTGSVISYVSGGTSPYTYLWSNSATTNNITGIPVGNYSVTITDEKFCTASDSAIVTQLPALTVNGIVTNVTCNGFSNGSISLTVDGGTTPYSYMWNNGVTTQNLSNISSGNYSLTVTDLHFCSTTGSWYVSQPTAISITCVLGDVSCAFGNDGFIDITVTGGVSPYSYQWSNSSSTQDINNLTYNTYFVTVIDANQCLATGQWTISQPVEMIATSQHNNVSCFGGNDGSIDISVTGGTSPYTYHWSNSSTLQDINSLTAGTYSVTVTDQHNCTKVLYITVDQYPMLTVDLGADTTIAAGSNLCLFAGYHPDCSFLWSTGATTASIIVSATEIYSVTVTHNPGCYISDQISINVTECTAGISGDSVYCEGYDLLLQGQFFPGELTNTQLCAGNCGLPSGYCNSYGYDYSVFYYNSVVKIFNVSLNGSVNNSPDDSLSYMDFTSSLFSLIAKDHSYQLSLNSWKPDTFMYNYYVFFDWNRNGILNSSDERIFIGSSDATGSITLSAAINIPSYAVTGETLMRIISESELDNPVPGPCDTNFDGMTEDYKVEIIISETTQTIVDWQGPAGLSLNDYQLSINNITPGMNGWYVFSGQNGSGCNSEDSLYVTVNTLPVVQLGNDTTIYQGSDVYLFAGYQPGCSFIWSTGQTTPCILVDTAGTYYLTVTNNLTGCTGTDNIIISIMPLTCLSDAGPDSVVCAGSSISFTGSFDSEIPTYVSVCQSSCSMPAAYCSSYGYDYGPFYPLYQKIINVQLNGSSNPSDSSLYSDFTSGLFTVLEKDSLYYLSVTFWKYDNVEYFINAYIDWNRDGDFNDLQELVYLGSDIDSAGTGILTVPFIVPPFSSLGQTRMRIIGKFYSSPGACETGFDGETEDYKIEIIDNQAYVPSVNWHGPGNLTINDYELDLNNISTAQGGWYTFTGQLDTICIASDSLYLTVNPLPVVELGNDTTIYQGSNVYLFAGYQPSGTYSWSGGQTTQTLLVTSAGTYSVTVTNSLTGCQDADNIVVTVDPTSCSTDAGNDTVLCAGGNVMLNSSYVATDVSYTGICTNGCNMGSSYCESFGYDYGPLYTLYQKITNVQFNGSVNPSDSSLYSDFTSLIFTVLETGLTCNLSITCWKLDNTVYQYWAFFDWNRDNDFADAGEPVFIGSTAGSGTIQLNVQVTVPANSVLGQTRMRIIGIFDAAPSPCEQDFDGETEDYKVEIISVQDFSPVFAWTGPQGYSSNIENPIITNISTDQSGYYYFNLSIGFGCSLIDSVLIIVNPLPIIDLGPDQVVCEGVTVVLDAGNPGSSYYWSPVNETSQVISLSDAGIYQIELTVTDVNGCISSDSVNITINEKPVTNPIIHE
jgi:hypothetical protein